MAIKSSNVAARVEPELKARAEGILAELGIPASTAINIFYREIVLWNGLPFRPSIPSGRPPARDGRSTEVLDKRMAVGPAQAKAGQGRSADAVYADLIRDTTNEP